MTGRVSVLLEVICATAVLANTAMTERIKACPKIEVLSLTVKPELQRNIQEKSTPKIEVTKGGAADEPVTLVASGPVLGSMDSADIDLRVLCTEQGVAVTAVISRSEHYTGATLQNQLWRPVMTTVVRLRTSEALFVSRWTMQLTNGQPLSIARTPPYPAQSYPVQVARTLRITSSEKR